ncbi:MAG: sulfatase-like hydrolase/transferase [Thiolinea sp.]
MKNWQHDWQGAVIVMMLAAGLCYLQSFALPFSFLFETDYLAQPYDQKGLLKGGLYLISYLLAIFAVLSVIFLRRSWLAVLAIIFIALIYAADSFVQLLGSSDNGLTVEMLSIAINEAGRADMMLAYRHLLIYAALIFLGLCLLFWLIRRQLSYLSFSGRWIITGLLFAALLAGGLVFKIPSITSHSYPAPVKLPVMLTEYVKKYAHTRPRVLDAAIRPQQPRAYQTIVWIVDESISGDYLSLNGYSKPTTPYLESVQDAAYLKNFGVVNAVSNCSNTSNLFLRIGLTTDLEADFDQARQTLPTIFQYAKRAGYEVHLLDAQVSSGELQNHLTAHDLKQIDQHITFSRQHLPAQRDQLIADYLRDQLASDDNTPRFIVAVKWGAHWPYPLAFPAEKTVFKPSATESFTSMTQENREILLNAYANVLRHSVDDFTHSWQPQQLTDEQIVFYTSDHGQSLFEHDDTLTHCHYAADPQQLPQGEFRVPLLVFTPQAKQKFSSNQHHLYSQQQLFSTTLRLFGYPESVYRKHGPTLFEGNPELVAESFVLDSGLKIRLTPAMLRGNGQQP